MPRLNNKKLAKKAAKAPAKAKKAAKGPAR